MFFFFNDTATTEIYTLSLHDALPISFCHAVPSRYHLMGVTLSAGGSLGWWRDAMAADYDELVGADRKSTRLNSSHANISYAVFCLKKTIILYTRPPFTLVVALL